MFKVGDTVKCIRNDFCKNLNIGYIYKVQKANLVYNRITVYDNKNNLTDYSWENFELCQDNEQKRKELEDAVKIIHKYGCVASYTIKNGSKKNLIVYSRDFRPAVETFIENVFNDHGLVKSPAQIEAEKIREEMQKLEKRLEELSKAI